MGSEASGGGGIGDPAAVAATKEPLSGTGGTAGGGGTLSGKAEPAGMNTDRKDALLREPSSEPPVDAARRPAETTAGAEHPEERCVTRVRGMMAAQDRAAICDEAQVRLSAC